MPAVVENRRKWSEHGWEHAGHKWSPGGTASGTAMMWWRAVRPRIQTSLPAVNILEIAPGYGRWTAHLLGECQQLTGVDLTPRCIDVCRERFAALPTAQFWVNDGESLPMVADASIDFAFSLDSLVHVEAPQIRLYLEELARTLRPGGTAFLHHSNLGAYGDRSTGAIPAYITERHWRAPSMSARVFREACRDAGLVCLTQEMINWIGREAVVDRHRFPAERIPLTDCFSFCLRPSDAARPDTRVYVNRGFVNEWREMITMTPLYAPGGAVQRGPTESHAAADRAGSPRNRPILAARALVASRIFQVREPLVRALRRNRCPDCQGPVRRDAELWRCAACATTYALN